MNLLRQLRATGATALLLALFFASGNANAIQIDIGGFAANGSLSIMFAATEMGGDPDKLEIPFPDDLTAFSAVYDDDALATPIFWDETAVGSLVYDVSSGILESLSALNFDFFELSVGDSVLDAANYVEITNLFSNEMISSQEFPSGAVPVPGTLVLLSLGVLLMGLRRS